MLERRGPPTFPIVVEIRDRAFYVAHYTEDSVDALLNGKVPKVQVSRQEAAVTAHTSLGSQKDKKILALKRLVS